MREVLGLKDGEPLYEVPWAYQVGEAGGRWQASSLDKAPQMEYEIRQPFGIDNGELDGLGLQQCFVLGYEMAQVDSLLRSPDVISKPIHAANRQRIEAACRAAGRRFKIVWMHEDVSEGWMMLDVSAEAGGLKK